MTKMIVFDLDGVLIDSRENMKVSWQQVNKKLNFGVKFSDYFLAPQKSFIGIFIYRRSGRLNVYSLAHHIFDLTKNPSLSY